MPILYVQLKPVPLDRGAQLVLCSVPFSCSVRQEPIPSEAATLRSKAQAVLPRLQPARQLGHASVVRASAARTQLRNRKRRKAFASKKLWAASPRVTLSFESQSAKMRLAASHSSKLTWVHHVKLLQFGKQYAWKCACGERYRNVADALDSFKVCALGAKMYPTQPRRLQLLREAGVAKTSDDRAKWRGAPLQGVKRTCPVPFVNWKCKFCSWTIPDVESLSASQAMYAKSKHLRTHEKSNKDDPLGTQSDRGSAAQAAAAKASKVRGEWLMNQWQVHRPAGTHDFEGIAPSPAGSKRVRCKLCGRFGLFYWLKMTACKKNEPQRFSLSTCQTLHEQLQKQASDECKMRRGARLSLLSCKPIKDIASS